MHQLQLLPGVGNKRLWQILEARKKRDFKNFNDFTERTGISDPTVLFVNRILNEIQGSEKYNLFIQKQK
jgi:putative nucleotide binding protein